MRRGIGVRFTCGHSTGKDDEGWVKRLQDAYLWMVVVYLCAVATFILWVYSVYLSSEITPLSIALLVMVIAFALSSIGTLLMKVGRIQEKLERR